MINPFGPVVPPDAFALTDAGTTFVRASRGPRPGVELLRHFDHAPGSFTLGAVGTRYSPPTPSPRSSTPGAAPVTAASRGPE